MSNSKKTTANITNTTKAAYEAKVIGEALERAGHNPNLHGHIHELLIRDAINVNPARIIAGDSARLVANPTAKTVDVVVINGKKVVERIQAKDTAESIAHTLKQIRSGQYSSAKVLGTEETVNAFARHADKISGAKTIQSSGISSSTTKSLATRAGASGGSSLSSATLAAAKSGGAVGGAVCGGVALCKGVYDLTQGTRDLKEVAIDVAKETTGGALSGAAASAAAVSTGAAVAGGCAALGITGAAAASAVVAAPVVVAVGVGFAIKSVWDWLFD